MAVIRILCWPLNFIIKLRFPPGLSLAVLKSFPKTVYNINGQPVKTPVKSVFMSLAIGLVMSINAA